jgi:hypothetical protein
MVEALSGISDKEVKHKALTNVLVIDAGADTGLVEIVPQVTGKRIVVTGFKFSGLSVTEIIGGEQTTQVEFFSGSTALTGKWQGTFDWIMDAGYNPDGHFQTEKSEALKYKITNTHGSPITCGLEVVLSYIEK